MARLARVVIPDLPHHVTHRGNRRGDIFMRDDDLAVYLDHLRHCAAGALLSPTRPFPGPTTDWAAWLAGDEDQQATDAIRARTRTGRPCSDKAFVQSIEQLTGRELEPQPPGPKPAGGHLPGQGDLFDE